MTSFFLEPNFLIFKVDEISSHKWNYKCLRFLLMAARYPERMYDAYGCADPKRTPDDPP